ncbi:MAG: deoxyguanosinetriphosphate triphosphohydrolase [Lachnospiraceae bacterium]|nr:deoxyguanosinetriphosphate triphosphohydrolase [Lachnospiraceae bacterium]
MNIREKQEQKEKQDYSPFAALSMYSRGRIRRETECDIRTCYQRDRDRILHSKAFRRMKDKTQVFMSPKGDHYRTRLTHTLEVSQTARTVSKALELNETLTEAIALGHDLGHTPFGHAGEHALSKLCSDGFKHYDQSIRVVEILEKDGEGLNLTYEVKDGIRNHSTANMPSTLEGKIVRLADKIAYINHDIDDAIRGKVLREEELPKEYTHVLGHTIGERINTMVRGIIVASEGKNEIAMEAVVFEAMTGLRQFMFQNVYRNPICIREEKKVEHIIECLFEYYCYHMDELPQFCKMNMERGTSVETAVCDYIAGMTDHYAIEKFREYYEPKFWMV